MAINITAPLSGYLDRTQTITVSWNNTNSDLSGKQSSYELQYKLPSETGWNTLGIVESANTSASLNEMFDIAENVTYSDATEYYYRVVVRYDNVPAGIEFVTGTEYSDVYSVAFHGGKVGEVKTVGEVYPIYDNVIGTSGLHVQITEDKTGAVPLVANGSMFAGRAKGDTTRRGVRSLATTRTSSAFNEKRANASGELFVHRPFYTNSQYYNNSSNFIKGYDASTGHEYDEESTNAFLYTKYNYSAYRDTRSQSYYVDTTSYQYLSSSYKHEYNTGRYYSYNYSSSYTYYYTKYYITSGYQRATGYRYAVTEGYGYQQAYTYYYKYYYYTRGSFPATGYETRSSTAAERAYSYYNVYGTNYVINYAYNYYHTYTPAEGYYISGGYSIPVRSYTNFIGYGYNYSYKYS